MPRKYKKQNIHTNPSKAGVQNMPEDYIEKHSSPKNEGAMDGICEMLEISFKRPRETAWDRESLAREISEYFSYSEQHNLKPCKAGLRLWLAVSKSQYYDWETLPNKYGDVSVMINHANSAMELQYVKRSESYPTANLFLLETSHGHQKSSKLDINANTTVTTTQEILDVVSKLGLDK